MNSAGELRVCLKPYELVGWELTRLAADLQIHSWNLCGHLS